MSDVTEPNAKIMEIVEQQYRNEPEVSKEQKKQIALLMTRSLADSGIRMAVESIEHLDKSKNEYKEKYRKDGYSVQTNFSGGDLGQLTKVTLKKDGKAVELSGKDFDGLKEIYDKRASQVKGLHLDVLRIAANDDLSAQVALRAGTLLYVMACSGDIDRKLLESIEKQSPLSETRMSRGLDEPMLRALAAFEKSAGELPVGGSPGSLATARPRKEQGGGIDRA